MTIVGDSAQGDTELVIINTVRTIGATFQDDSKVPITPAALSLLVTDLGGNTVLEDIYLPTTMMSPDPPRILNPSTGKYLFPLGLDNGSTDPLKTNKSSEPCEYMFTWRGSSVAAVTATATIPPILWTSVATGTPGNFIRIEYINPGAPNRSLSIVRDGAQITVNLATNAGSIVTTTAADAIAAVLADSSASEIVAGSVAPGYLPTSLVAAASLTPLTGGIDADQESIVCVNVKVISHRLCSLINKFRLLIDKTHKLVNNDPNDPCYLGYSNGQLWQFLTSGLQIINSYQPYGVFTFCNFPYGNYDFILMETSLLAGMMSQSMFAIDTDVPQFSDQGNAFVITHYTQLAQYINWLSQRLNTMIPQFKLHFVQTGSMHMVAGPNMRLATLITAAPSGSLFRNFYTNII